MKSIYVAALLLATAVTCQVQRTRVLLASALPVQAPAELQVRADELYRTGEFTEAAKLYRTLVEQDSSNEKAQKGLIRSLLKNDDVEESVLAGSKAIGALPSSAPIHAAVGDVSFREGELGEAERHYRKALEADSRIARGYFGMAKVYASSFNRRAMRDMDRKAYELDPEDPEIIRAYATDLPADTQIPLLEKYLQVGLNELADRKDAIRERIAYLKKMGDRGTWLLEGTPRATTIKLGRINPAPGRHTGYRVKLAINGKKPVDLHLDTGASGVLIHRKLAEKLGVELISESTFRGVGDEGKRKAYQGLAQSIKIGDLEFRDCVIEISDKRLSDDGLIGVDTSQQFLVSLNLPENRIELEPLPAINGQRYDNPKSWLELDRTPIPELEGFVQVRKWGHLLLDTLVNDKRRGFFLLDTGASTNVISQRLARQVTSLAPTNMRIRGLSGDVKDTASARKVVLQVGRFRQENDGILAISFREMSKSAGLEVSGLIGNPILSQLVITIDYRDGLINLSYPYEKKK